MNIADSGTFLLYSDKRVDLKSRAYTLCDSILNENNIKENSENFKDIYFYDNIKIDDVRNIIDLAIKSAYEGVKIFILNIMNLNIQSYNAMLKIIEEPTKGTYFILYSYNLNIPKTILSRAILKYESPTRNKEIEKKYYQFTNSNVEFEKKFLEDNINLNDYVINNMSDCLNALKAYMEERTLYSRISYIFSIDYILTNLKNESVKNKLHFINNLIEIYTNRSLTIEFFDDILIKTDLKYNVNKFFYLVNIKNSLKNNTNLKNIMFIFIVEILGGI